MLNNDKHNSSSDEEMDGGDIITTSYTYLNVLHEAEEETQSEESSDDDYSKEGSNYDNQESILYKNGNSICIMLRTPHTGYSQELNPTGQPVHS